MTDFRDRALGAFIGLAVGDALGAPLEFSARDSLPPVRGYRAGGPFNLRAGEWTDDTACALALAHAILEDFGGVSKVGILQHLRSWYREGKYSSNGRCFDIGSQTRKAIEHFERTGRAPDRDDNALGNGGIMRLAPVLLVAPNAQACAALGGLQSEATHPSYIGSLCASGLASILWHEAHGQKCNDPSIAVCSRNRVNSSGHVQHTMEAADWCVGNSSNFEEAVLLAANLGDDSDTVAAVTGQWAGARYGLGGIPLHWLEGLHQGPMLLSVAERLLALRR